jgi:tetratricopeptide (TPR) repeat protein
VLNELGRSDEARDTGRQARALVDRLQGDNTLLPGLLSAEARALPAGHPEKIALYEESLALRRADPKLADPIAMAATLNNLGANVGGEDPERAHAFFSEALQIRERVQGPDHPDALVNALNLVGLDYEVGNYGDCMERGPRVYAALPESELSGRALAAEIVAGCSIEVRAFVEGLEWIDRAIAIQAALDPEGTSYAAMLEIKAILVSHRAEWTETEALLQRALVLREALSRGPNGYVAHSRYRLAVAARQLGELDRAEAYARRSLTEAASIPDAQGILHARTMLARILVDAGRHAEAVDVLAEYLDLPADGTVDPMYVANAKGVYASAAWEVGNRSRAIELAREAADALARRPDFIAEHDEVRIWLGSHS